MGQSQRTVLPNGQVIAHLNRGETDYLYQEIYVNRTYTPPGFPRLGPEAVIFDVGANIGLFTLFALEQWPGSRVYAFEPVPAICQVLSENLHPHSNARVIQAALGKSTGTAKISYYPHYSMMSGLHADRAADYAIARQYLENLTSDLQDDADRATITAAADTLLAGRFESVILDCAVETVESSAAKFGIDHIDLLKVDVERGELDVIRGIHDDLWPQIRNVVIEVEGDARDISAISSVLDRHGMHVTVSQPRELRGTELHMLYASR